MSNIVIEAKSDVSIVKEPSLDLRYKQLAGPTYAYTKLQPNNLGSSLSIGTSLTEALFNIPAGVINLSRSYAFMSPSVVTPSGGIGWFNWFFVDTPPLQSINLKSRLGITMANVDNAQKYCKTARYDCTRIDEMGKSPIIMATTTAASWMQGKFLQQSQALGSAAFATVAATPAWVLNAGTTSAGALSISAGVDVSYTSPQVLTVGADDGGAGSGASGFNMALPLNAFPHTVMSLDRDIYYPEDLQLTMTFLPIVYWGFQMSSASAPTNAAAATLGAITLSNFALYVAYDQDNMNKQELKNKVLTEGMRLNIPYVNCFRDASPASTSYMTSYTFSRGHGKSLKRVYTAVAASSETLNNVCNMDNVNSSKITSLQTSINSKPIQNNRLYVATQDIWANLEPILNGSAVQSQRIHDSRFHWVDNFAGDRPSVEWCEHDDEEGGYDLSQPVVYNGDFTQATAAQRIYYTFAVTDRDLVLSASGIQVL